MIHRLAPSDGDDHKSNNFCSNCELLRRNTEHSNALMGFELCLWHLDSDIVTRLQPYHGLALLMLVVGSEDG